MLKSKPKRRRRKFSHFSMKSFMLFAVRVFENRNPNVETKGAQWRAPSHACETVTFLYRRNLHAD